MNWETKKRIEAIIDQEVRNFVSQHDGVSFDTATKIVLNDWEEAIRKYQFHLDARIKSYRTKIWKKALKNPRLTPREKDILCFRFGMVDGVAHTLEECGKRIGVTRERIRQIETKALEKSI